jgi:hypothetical protein
MPFNSYNPNSNPVTRGMMNALSIASYLQRAQMQQQQLAMAKRREARMEEQAAAERQARDLDILAKMNQAGRPVQGGMVEDSLVGLLPDAQLKQLGIEDPTQFQIMRPPAGPVAKYKDADGRVHEFEFLTPDEQVARQQKAALNLLEQQGAIKNKQAIDLFNAQTFDLPGYGKVNKAAVPAINALIREQGSNARSQAGIDSRERVANQNNVVRVATTAASIKAANERAATRERGANARNAASNASRERTAAAQMNQLQREHDELDRDEQKLWTRVNAIKATLAAGKTLRDGKEVKLNALEMAKLKQQEADLRREAATLQQQKRNKLGQMGKPIRALPRAGADSKKDPLGIR